MQTTAKFETITPNKAKQYLSKNKSNRPLNINHVRRLENEMKLQRFELTGDSIKISKSGSLIDGQHRLMAIINTKINQKMLCVKGLSDDAFKFIDTGKNRSAADVLGIMKIANCKKIASMVKFILVFKRGQYGSAANRHTSSMRIKSITNADVSAFVISNLEELTNSMPFGWNKENKLLSSSVLASLHFILTEINNGQADDFCWKVASGENVKKDDSIYHLRQRLLSDIRSTKKISKMERLALVCKAWNFYRQSKSIQILKWDSIKEPFPKPL